MTSKVYDPIPRDRYGYERISTESTGSTAIRAHRENSHSEQVQMTSAVFCFDSAAYCSNGYVIVVDCGCN